MLDPQELKATLQHQLDELHQAREQLLFEPQVDHAPPSRRLLDDARAQVAHIRAHI